MRNVTRRKLADFIVFLVIASMQRAEPVDRMWADVWLWRFARRVRVRIGKSDPEARTNQKINEEAEPIE